MQHSIWSRLVPLLLISDQVWPRCLIFSHRSAIVCSSLAQCPYLAACGGGSFLSRCAPPHARPTIRSRDARRPPTHFRRHALVRSLARPFARRPARSPARGVVLGAAAPCSQRGAALSTLRLLHRLSSARLQFDLAACVRLRAVLPPHGYTPAPLRHTRCSRGVHRSLASRCYRTLAALPLCTCSFVWFRVFSCVQLALQVSSGMSAACWCVKNFLVFVPPGEALAKFF